MNTTATKTKRIDAAAKKVAELNKRRNQLKADMILIGVELARAEAHLEWVKAMPVQLDDEDLLPTNDGLAKS